MSSITCTQTKNVHLLSTASKKIIKYQSIAPAMCPTSNIGGHHNDNDENKSRKYSQRISSYNSDPTQSVLRRNARERNRVKQVNNSFARLRQHIPQTIIADLTKSGGRGPHKKISKVDTLRIAVEYIRRLQNLLDDLNGNGNGSYTNFVNTTKNSRNILKTLTSCKSTSNIRQHFSPQITNISAVNSENKISAPANITIRTETENVAELNINRNTILLSSAVSLNSFSPQHKNTTQMDIDCKSPASTFNSNLSGDSSIYDHNSQTLQKQPIMPDQNSLIVEHLQLKFEPYENFHLHEDNCTPDDEEILDYISLWQDQ